MMLIARVGIAFNFLIPFRAQVLRVKPHAGMSAYLTYLRNCILHCLSCEDYSGMLILLQGVLREYSNKRGHRVGANTGESTHLDKLVVEA